MVKEGINKIIVSKSKTLLAFCFCFIMGAILGTSGLTLPVGALFFYLAIFAFAFLAVVFWQNLKIRFLFLAGAFLFLGFFRALIFPPLFTPSHISYYNNQPIEFMGQVATEPDIRISKSYYVIEAQQLAVTSSKNIFGRIKITAPLYPQYNYGDHLQIYCAPQTPAASEDFRYDMFLAKDKIYSECYYPRIQKLSNLGLDNLGIKIIKPIFVFKKIIADRVNSLWPEPAASLEAGLLYGYRGGLPAELSENFKRAGLTHIIAISGFNISIISLVLFTFLIYLGLNRYQAFYVTLLGIGLFVILVGASASVVRAAVMGSLVLLAKYLGRPAHIFNIIIIALALMIFINPYSLWWDAGFQLSFLSVLGIIYLSPALEKYLFKLFNLKPTNFSTEIITVVASTLSAIISTLPLILFNFGRFSLIAPVANVLVLWIIPWLMLFGFLAVVLSFIFYPLGLVCAWFTNLGLSFVIFVINHLGGYKYAAFDLKFSWWLMILSYIILLCLYFKKIKNQKN